MSSATMISSNILRTATKTWPFLYAFKLSTVSSFSLSTTATSASSILDSIIVTNKNIPYQPWKLTHNRSILNSRHYASSSDNYFTSSGMPTSTSATFALDPRSEKARTITKSLGVDDKQHEKLIQLSHLVVEWNERLNLISRKDCNPEVVFGRHILPSIALAGLPQLKDVANNVSSTPRIVDVGTGGGFPGLPLSIIYPHVNFLLVDSVGKKVKAVEEMSFELNLKNIAIHHGRAEQIADDPTIGGLHRKNYDICVGRSVTSMPKFCFWIQDLLKNDGKLVYIIGGQVEESVQSRVDLDIEIDELLKYEGVSDKRILTLSSPHVIAAAKESGEKKITSRKRQSNIQRKNRTRQKKDGTKWNKSKGSWSERNNSEQKERGYSNFKRYESN